MIPDQELLRQYADEGSEAAFAEVVRRHVDFVHSAARRIAAQDTQLAEDITLRVFTVLARQARPLSRHQSLAGWLHRCTRYVALAALRAEQRRRAREQEAATMQALTTPPPETSWEQLRPLLDEAVDQLGQADREAVLLRYFLGKSHREVGDALGLSENSANKRVERALEKLRAYFARRGVTASAALLGEAISANSVQAAPAGMADKLTPASLAVAATSSGTGWLLFFFNMSTRTKTILTLLVLLAIVATLALQFGHFHEPAIISPPAVSVTPAAPKVVAKTPMVASALPVARRVASDAPTAAGLDSASNDAQASLDTAILDIVALYQANDLVAFRKKYTPPLMQNTPQFQQMLRRMEADQNQEAANKGLDPQMDKMQDDLLQGAVKSWEDLENQTPSYNDAGDQAYFIYTYPAPNGGPGSKAKRIFSKIDGKWYWTGDVDIRN